ncbi:MAG: NAD-binding protein, partial [Pseudomonadota bacterium]
GGIVNRILREAGHETIVLDYSSAQLEMLRTFGLRVYFGDASRPDLLHAAGIEQASMIVIAIDGREQITELVRYVATNHPEIHIVARAVNRPHVYELYAAGCRDIVRETFDSSVRAGRSALEALGHHPFEAERIVRTFTVNDRKQIAALAGLYDPSIPLHENTAYVEKTKEIQAENRRELTGHDRAFRTATERGWSPPTLADVDAEEARVGDGEDASTEQNQDGVGAVR